MSLNLYDYPPDVDESIDWQTFIVHPDANAFRRLVEEFEVIPYDTNRDSDPIGFLLDLMREAVDTGNEQYDRIIYQYFANGELKKSLELDEIEYDEKETTVWVKYINRLISILNKEEPKIDIHFDRKFLLKSIWESVPEEIRNETNAHSLDRFKTESIYDWFNKFSLFVESL